MERACLDRRSIQRLTKYKVKLYADIGFYNAISGAVSMHKLFASTPAVRELSRAAGETARTQERN
jgi:hypothetical protein